MQRTMWETSTFSKSRYQTATIHPNVLSRTSRNSSTRSRTNMVYFSVSRWTQPPEKWRLPMTDQDRLRVRQDRRIVPLTSVSPSSWWVMRNVCTILVSASTSDSANTSIVWTPLSASQVNPWSMSSLICISFSLLMISTRWNTRWMMIIFSV